MDIRTLSILISITNFMQVIALYLQYRANKTYRGIGWWAMGFTAIAIGFVLLLLRDVITIKLITIISGNALTVSGMIFFYIGIMQFLDKKANLWIVISILAVFILPFFYYTYVNDDIAIRTVVASVALAASSFLAAQGLFVSKTRTITASANLMSAVFLANGCFFGFRAVAVLKVAPVNTFFAPTLLQVAAFLEPFIVGILLAYGFIIMVNQRLIAESREATEHFELIFSTGLDATLITRLHDGLVININEGFTALTGFTRDETIGKSSLDINIWKNPADRQKVVNELGEKGFCENFEAIFQRKDGSPIIGSMSAKIITLQGLPHIISVTRDITERKQAEEALHQVAEQLAAQNAELDAFAHTVAHDLKGLLSVILGYATVLADDAAALASPDWGASLTSIIKTAQRMNSVIEALLLLAATRQGQIESEPLDMAQIVAEAQDRQRPMIAEYQAEIALPANWPVALGVAPWVEEVWINYLSNALKYGGQPPRVELGATTQANGQVRFWVRDHGLGIAPEAQARLFAPFTRLRQVSVDGHGLGLSIVRRIVEKLGGEVGVESALGQGNVFFFTLPLATSPDTLAVRIKPINLSP